MAKRTYSRSGTVRWYDEGCSYRADGPASVYVNGTQWWFRRGLCHFAHGPAVVWPNGWLRWYEEGEYLRERTAYG